MKKTLSHANSDGVARKQEKDHEVLSRVVSSPAFSPPNNTNAGVIEDESSNNSSKDSSDDGNVMMARHETPAEAIKVQTVV